MNYPRVECYSQKILSDRFCLWVPPSWYCLLTMHPIPQLGSFAASNATIAWRFLLSIRQLLSTECHKCSSRSNFCTLAIDFWHRCPAKTSLRWSVVNWVWHSPAIEARGFLIQRLTFKCCVLSAIFKLFNRRNLPINELDSQPSQRVCLQKRTRILT